MDYSFVSNRHDNLICAAAIGKKGCQTQRRTSLETPMDPALLSALSAILGSLVGGSASVGAAWVTQKAHTTRELMTSEIRKRETLYGEFIAECSKLLIDAMDHTFDTPSKLLDVYAIENRIRLTSTDEVLVAAERTIVDIVRQYLEPTLTNDAIRERAMAYTRDYLAVEDPIKPFAEACRRELAALRVLL